MTLAKYDDLRTTRVEYQLRRPVLMQMKIDSLADLEDKRNAAWLYCTKEWTRLCCQEVDRGNRNQSRIHLHPWWKEVALADISLECEPIKREYPRATKDLEALATQSAGCMLSACTILNQRPDDLDGAIHYATVLITAKFRQMWENKDEKGIREFEQKMKKRRSEVWPLGFENKPEISDAVKRDLLGLSPAAFKAGVEHFTRYNTGKKALEFNDQRLIQG